jgi:hypothetical protein
MSLLKDNIMRELSNILGVAVSEPTAYHISKYMANIVDIRGVENMLTELDRSFNKMVWVIDSSEPYTMIGSYAGINNLAKISIDENDFTFKAQIHPDRFEIKRGSSASLLEAKNLVETWLMDIINEL